MTRPYCKISCFPESGLSFCDGIGRWTNFFVKINISKLIKKKNYCLSVSKQKRGPSFKADDIITFSISNNDNAEEFRKLKIF